MSHGLRLQSLWTIPTAAVSQHVFEWIAATALRNLVLIWIFAGGWHLLLYTLKLK